MQIKLNLILSVILEAVKAETHIKSVTDKAADDKATALAYHEDAGDETLHERKLMRGIYTSLDKLRSLIADYLDDSSSSIADNNISADIDSTNDSITIILNTDERFNVSNTDSLARLASKFIEDNTLFLWWGTINQKQAEYYQLLTTEDMASITRIFMKRAPKYPTISYTKNIGVEGSTVYLTAGEVADITYTIDTDVMDDVDIKCEDGNVGVVGVGKGVFIVKAERTGMCDITLFSKHDSDVSTTIRAVVQADYEKEPITIGNTEKGSSSSSDSESQCDCEEYELVTDEQINSLND